MLNIPKDQAIKIGLLLIFFLVLSSLVFATYRRVGGIMHELVQLRDQVELIQMDIGDILQKLKEFPLTKGILEEKEIVKEPPKEKFLTSADLDPNVNNWLTYRNNKYGIQFKYPKEVKITEMFIKGKEQAMPFNYDYYSIMIPFVASIEIYDKFVSRYPNIEEILNKSKDGEECQSDERIQLEDSCMIRVINDIRFVENYIFGKEGGEPFIRLSAMTDKYLYQFSIGID
ncbi:MAG: hypothetical protein HY602_02205, partial [Parcubacteria group bacterium]|nr:hypothetical protein [Parcubacteria group bacterium]